MKKTHLTTEDVLNEYGVPFNEIKDGSVENIFMRWLDRSSYISNGAAVLASINPVTPHHVFMIPTPRGLDAFQDESGNFHTQPRDSYLNEMNFNERISFMGSFANWIAAEHTALTGIDPARIKRSFMTTNEGHESLRAVKWAHAHDLILLDDEDYHSPDIQALGNVDNFCRIPKTDPLKLLKSADFQSLEESGNHRKLENSTMGFSSLAKLFADQVSLSSGPYISVIPYDGLPSMVRPGHTAIQSFFDFDSLPINKLLCQDVLQSIEFLAGALKSEFRKVGANGFTVVMDTTALRNPEVAEKSVNEHGRVPITQHIIPHPEGVPFVKGGFVYTLQKATAPAFQK